MLTRRELLALIGPVGSAAVLSGVIGVGGVQAAGVDYRLLMVVQRGCIYCAAWRREVGVGYPTSALGRSLPVSEVDIDGPWPDGLALARRPHLTPTFILLRNGQELGRIEGYPGPEVFAAELRDLAQSNRIAGFSR